MVVQVLLSGVDLPTLLDRQVSIFMILLDLRVFISCILCHLPCLKMIASRFELKSSI